MQITPRRENNRTLFQNLCQSRPRFREVLLGATSALVNGDQLIMVTSQRSATVAKGLELAICRHSNGCPEASALSPITVVNGWPSFCLQMTQRCYEAEGRGFRLLRLVKQRSEGADIPVFTLMICGSYVVRFRHALELSSPLTITTPRLMPKRT
jgi:hypothetical protein